MHGYPRNIGFEPLQLTNLSAVGKYDLCLLSLTSVFQCELVIWVVELNLEYKLSRKFLIGRRAGKYLYFKIVELMFKHKNTQNNLYLEQYSHPFF